MLRLQRLRGLMSARPARRRGVERGAGSPRHGLGRATALAAVLAAGAASPLRAQTNLETNSAIQFNFAAPGAANLALGGAFIGLAFDGTAAYTNPAGLTNILRPEVWIEGRSWSYTHVYTDQERVTGQHAPPGADPVDHLRAGEVTDTVLGPSFVSYVHPGTDWSLAFYAHQLLDFEAGFETRGALLEPVRSTNPQGFGVLGERTGRLPALRNRMETDIESVGIAAAYRFGPSVSVGASLSGHRFRMDSRAERFVPELLTEAPKFNDAERRSVQTQEGEDDDWSFGVGALWQSPHRVFSVGAVYRNGADFDFLARSESLLAQDEPLFFELPGQPAVFHVPDAYGIGFACRPTDRLTLAVDYARVEYSDLLDDAVDIFDLQSLLNLQGLPDFDDELEAFRIDDADEVHVGVELWLPRPSRAVSLRLGSWYDPDHTLRFEGKNLSYRAVFRGGSDEIHLTAGAGVALPTVQVDLAFDYSDRVSIVSLSAGRRF